MGNRTLTLIIPNYSVLEKATSRAERQRGREAERQRGRGQKTEGREAENRKQRAEYSKSKNNYTLTLII